MERSQRIVCRISEGELGLISRAADRAGLTLSGFVRARTIGDAHQRVADAVVADVAR